MLLDVGAIALSSRFWGGRMAEGWLYRKREDRRFVVDSGEKVSTIEYVLPMCLASADTFAKDSDTLTRRAIAQFISGACK